MIRSTKHGSCGFWGGIRSPFILLLICVGVYFCYRLAFPFLPAITWALVLSILLAPVHQRLHSRLGSANLAAGLSVAAAAIIVLVLLILVAHQLVREAAGGLTYLQEALRTLNWQDMIGNRPRLATAVTWIEQRLDPVGALSVLAQWLTTQSTYLLRGSITQVISFALTFYMLFYFLRDRDTILRTMAKLSPMRPAEAALVAVRLVDIVHATLFGTVAVAAVQGALGGLVFWWLGLPTPVFWGLVMGILAIVPVLGAFVIWVPAAIYLSIEGQWASALILTMWGAVVIATIDNLLYPVLVGERLRMHTLAVFVSAVGGIILFGPSGLFLGPAIVAITMTLMEIQQVESGLGNPGIKKVEQVGAKNS